MLAPVLESVATMPSLEAVPAPVHVLAIDDDPSVRQMIADYLTDNDIQVTAVGSGKEIAEVVGNHLSYRRVVVDRQNMDGRSRHSHDRACFHEVEIFSQHCGPNLASRHDRDLSLARAIVSVVIQQAGRGHIAVPPRGSNDVYAADVGDWHARRNSSV